MLRRERVRFLEPCREPPDGARRSGKKAELVPEQPAEGAAFPAEEGKAVWVSRDGIPPLSGRQHKEGPASG